jgi:hypothetical protein
MTKRLITALAVALATTVAFGLLGLASGRTAAATEPTLTVTRDCESYRDVGADSIAVRLTGLPPSTPFEWTLHTSMDTDLGAWPDPRRPETTDANGNWEPQGFGGEQTHAIWTVTIFWSGGTLMQSLYVDCTSPDGAVTVIPPDNYSPNCGASGEALQGHGDDDTIVGSIRFDLLRGGGGDDSLVGERRPDCLFGQEDADAISGQEDPDSILGQRGADELKGGPADDSIRGGRGKDTISGGKGNDHILDTDGRNRISCGRGFDRVKTIEKSEVAGNCERVHIRRDFDEPL